jgi:hypothetical protein
VDAGFNCTTIDIQAIGIAMPDYSARICTAAARNAALVATHHSDVLTSSPYPSIPAPVPSLAYL